MNHFQISDEIRKQPLSAHRQFNSNCTMSENTDVMRRSSSVGPMMETEF